VFLTGEKQIYTSSTMFIIDLIFFTFLVQKKFFTKHSQRYCRYHTVFYIFNWQLIYSSY